MSPLFRRPKGPATLYEIAAESSERVTLVTLDTMSHAARAQPLRAHVQGALQAVTPCEKRLGTLTLRTVDAVLPASLKSWIVDRVVAISGASA